MLLINIKDDVTLKVYYNVVFVVLSIYEIKVLHKLQTWTILVFWRS